MELELFVSPVGLVALSAGVANDVVGWTLLAVSVALAQAGSGILAIYMLLCCVGWALLMVYGVRPLLRRFVRASLAEDSSPAETHLAAVAVVVLISALFTGMIGKEVSVVVLLQLTSVRYTPDLRSFSCWSRCSQGWGLP